MRRSPRAWRLPTPRARPTRPELRIPARREPDRQDQPARPRARSTGASATIPKATDDSLQCATLTVPLDYDDPSGKTIDLALVRVPAAKDRKGAILFNPGGPGGSGFDYIAQGGTFISSEMGLENFDLIGFDPRGVDRSNGLRCLTDASSTRPPTWTTHRTRRKSKPPSTTPTLPSPRPARTSTTTRCSSIRRPTRRMTWIRSAPRSATT